MTEIMKTEKTSKQYVPDLVSLQLLGELNYRRLGRLMRGQEEMDSWNFSVHSAGDQESRLRLTLGKESRFTSDIALEFGPEMPQKLLFKTTLSMTVRLYHDVGIAEITDGHRQYSGSYPYPNDAMLHRDEKFRLNQQLADLLELCLKHGHRLNSTLSFQFA
ncbi:DUF1249 domain-containing protein [Marinomonas rhizomae]|uniref:Uncharacterized protein YqiB (DUF1249 family) n=1 Tax=Marinomonas rhizomae TaxID=491948 RepID=A0A366J5W7_9GAMM|nr:DUF1249 domain-containing protein [Marinomonas rhizomae]RBP82431.1 uncharacterized protein YqiB (DUF1249 family) [Marinomonas rhizomae]RNF73775.1 DUF1249 domain-containing protein [Marinomonas rhizomae]